MLTLRPAPRGPAFSGPWPRPPAALPAARLGEPPAGARVTVAGLVILRQRPGTAKGVIFVTLEDETGVVNVVVWRALYERFRRAVIAARLLRVTGRLQREHGVTHVVAERIEDISDMLDALLAPEPCRAADQPGTTHADPRTPPARRGPHGGPG
ncbi:OB-fold nucleic acid binding domain-containing protein [Rhodosalinus sp. 5P4]|uniref:OB-fold nucleic acid binding domain-containing protein n=1 Tax=Rhodosalinus sp. 5P4 TaxID=3239196 RepID=UPI0035261C5D